MEELKRVKWMTENYNHLQGLRIAPLGLWFWAFGFGWFGRQGDCTYSLPAFLGIAFLMALIGRYYDRRFGKVKQEVNLVKGFFLVMAAFAVIWFAAYIDFVLDPAVSLTGLAMAFLMLVTFVRPRQIVRIHYLIMAGLIIVISFLPLTGLSSGGEILQAPGTAFALLIGSILILGGILDHFILVRSFKAAQEAIHG
jgi:hypothetical protein